MNAKDLQHSGDLYFPGDPEITKAQVAAQELLYDFNQTRPGEAVKRQKLLQKMFAEIGEHSYIEPPLHANFGAKFAHFGDHVYANYNLTMVDDTAIYIGDRTLVGPNVILAAGTHPVAPELRAREMQYNLPIHIGKNCWIGAGSIVMPGITIGDNTVVGAGSLVTKDIPANVVAYGSPAKVIREINDYDYDRKYYHQKHRINSTFF
ncbi:MAG: sugar O-acetyltransferase [Limosilactobacillus gorillae]|jgi:galactoside O-acetyltransferase|uniref:sugar O-acetyltransferase n=1 Tax=Limosilactobacillus gorillae TaxID=1450649 RepID=UPI000A5605CB|nr:sugar O-acetyltransferase [Limosilactobacillus gorillae]MDO4855211.1 sugar O-acetyltransferase [Limosilactobacillus gorillae]